jgi:hypothetical protein
MPTPPPNIREYLGRLLVPDKHNVDAHEELEWQAIKGALFTQTQTPACTA